MNTKTKIEVSSHEYVIAHDKAPKGFGCWGFVCDQCPTTEFWATGTFSTAVKAAKQELRALIPADFTGTVTLDVLS